MVSCIRLWATWHALPHILMSTSFPIFPILVIIQLSLILNTPLLLTSITAPESLSPTLLRAGKEISVVTCRHLNLVMQEGKGFFVKCLFWERTGEQVGGPNEHPLASRSRSWRAHPLYVQYLCVFHALHTLSAIFPFPLRNSGTMPSFSLSRKCFVSLGSGIYMLYTRIPPL